MSSARSGSRARATGRPKRARRGGKRSSGRPPGRVAKRSAKSVAKRVAKRAAKRGGERVAKRVKRSQKRATRPARRRRERLVRRIAERPELLEVRSSPVHGKGVFARRRIRKGTRVIEYLGDRVSHRQADERYENKSSEDGHTFLFIVDRGIVIDGGNNGNDARFINHGCDPNCESAIEDRRVFIEAVRTIEPGEELTYDYQIGRDRSDPPNVDEIFACRCGAPKCRGSMLWPPRRKPRASGEPRA